MSELTDKLTSERQKAVSEMGGAEKVAKIHAKGGYTARDWINNLVDRESFQEIGTFAQAAKPEQRDGSYGDGKICGHARVAGRPITVGADDNTVKGASEGPSNLWKSHRLYRQALSFGNPFVWFGQCGGGRVDDLLGAAAMTRQPAMELFELRQRRIPMITAIVGRSYGQSSFMAALSDFVVQLRGTAMAVTSPRVIQVATSETIDEEALGGADVHSERSGQIDLAVDTKDEAITAIQNFLSYVPNNAESISPRTESRRTAPEPALRQVVPQARRRAYDMRKVLGYLADDGRFLELKPRFGRALITALARVNGHSVGIVANQPMFQAGAMSPAGCDKAVRFICLCDSFNIPLVFLVDTPGFLVGSSVEHERLLSKAMMLSQALAHSRVPRVTFILRKAFGLAYFAMSCYEQGSTFTCAWPTAEISFMDPEVAANVVHAGQLEELSPEARRAQVATLSQRFAKETGAFDAAAVMGVDEIIDPAETPRIAGDAIERMLQAYNPAAAKGVLTSWPTCF